MFGDILSDAASVLPGSLGLMRLGLRWAVGMSRTIGTTHTMYTRSSSAALSPFFGEGSPTKIDYRKQVGTAPPRTPTPQSPRPPSPRALLGGWTAVSLRARSALFGYVQSLRSHFFMRAYYYFVFCQRASFQSVSVPRQFLLNFLSHIICVYIYIYICRCTNAYVDLWRYVQLYTIYHERL